MRLTKEQIEKYNNDFRIECTIESLEKEWYFDKQNGFQKISNLFTRRYINLKNTDNSWLRIPFDDLSQEQIETLLINKEPIDEEKLDKLAYNSVPKVLDTEESFGAWYEGFKAGYKKAMEE